MSEKRWYSRVVHKHDVESNWQRALSFVPMKGEIVVYDTDETYSYERFKIGDGITTINALPFSGSTNNYTTEEKEQLETLVTLIGDTTDPVVARENLLIVVSDTEPASPIAGMLWFDIS